MYRRKPNRAQFHGFTFVRLPDTFVRDATKVYRDGYLLAVSQRNGHIGVSGNAAWIITNATSVKAQYYATKCLRGLGLIGGVIMEQAQREYDAHELHLAFVTAENDADALGYRLVKLPKPKSNRVRKSSAK